MAVDVAKYMNCPARLVYVGPTLLIKGFFTASCGGINWLVRLVKRCPNMNGQVMQQNHIGIHSFRRLYIKRIMSKLSQMNTDDLYIHQLKPLPPRHFKIKIANEIDRSPTAQASKFICVHI